MSLMVFTMPPIVFSLLLGE